MKNMNDGICLHTLKGSDIWQKSSDCLLELLGTYKKNKVLLLLSGGSVVNLYKKLAEYLQSVDIKENSLVFAQVDERFQPGSNNPIIKLSNNQVSNENINSIQIGKTGLWEACRKKNIPYYLIPQEGTLDEAANNYNETLKNLFEHFSYKIGVLGIGEDGHTAGLLPGFEKFWNTQKYVVGYELGQNNPRGLSGQQNLRQRITVTPKALWQLDHAIIVAGGEKKREALEKIKDMRIKDMNKYPAVILRKIKKVDLFTDILIYPT